jgi:hypothetical protein
MSFSKANTHTSVWAAKTPIATLIAFFVFLLFQAFLPLVNVAEALLAVNILRLYKRIKLTSQELFLIILIFSGATITLIHHNDAAFFTYWHYCIIMPILLFLNGKLIDNESDLKRIVYFVSFACLVVWSVSIFQTPENIEIKDNQWTDEHTRMFRLFFAHDVVINGTGIIVFLIPSFSIFFMPAANNTQRYIKAISFFLILYCIYKSESRSSLIFLFAIFLYYVQTINLSSKIKYALLIITLIVFTGTFFDLSSFIPERFSLSYTEKTGLTSRDLIWASAIAIISQNFFGVITPYMEILGQTFSPHNNFLTYWILFGWIVGLSVTYAFFAIEIYAIRRRKLNARYMPFILTVIFINFFFETASIAIPFSFAFYAMISGYMLKNKNQSYLQKN